MSNTSTFAALAVLAPAMNSVRPTSCSEMRLGTLNILMASVESLAVVSRAVVSFAVVSFFVVSVAVVSGGLRIDSGYGDFTSDAGCALRLAMTLSNAGFGLYCLS